MLFKMFSKKYSIWDNAIILFNYLSKTKGMMSSSKGEGFTSACSRMALSKGKERWWSAFGEGQKKCFVSDYLGTSYFSVPSKKRGTLLGS